MNDKRTYISKGRQFGMSKLLKERIDHAVAEGLTVQISTFNEKDGMYYPSRWFYKQYMKGLGKQADWKPTFTEWKADAR